jgi:hypothetical protein
LINDLCTDKVHWIFSRPYPLCLRRKTFFNGCSSTNKRGNWQSMESVYVGLASMPSRINSLKIVIEKLLPQCGRIGVYLNNFEEVPSFLHHHKIDIQRSQDHGDLKDNGKFFFLDRTNLRYYASVDDDILYPENYIQNLLANQVLTRGIVGLHGAYYPKEIKSLFDSRFLVHFKEAFEYLLPVTLLGTGTSLIDQAVLRLKPSDFGEPGMADVWLANAAKKKGASLWLIPREANWLEPIQQSEESESQSLYVHGKRDDSHQVQVLKNGGISGSIPAILESLVRSPRASVAFSTAEANFLWSLTRSLQIELLRKQDRHLYDYAFARHKQFACERDSQSGFIDITQVYAKWLIELVSRDEGSIRRGEWVAEYFELLHRSKADFLPDWARKDLQGNQINLERKGHN